MSPPSRAFPFLCHVIIKSMNNTTQIIIIFILLGFLGLGILEVRIKMGRNAEAIVRLEKKADKNNESASKNAESIARLEGILIGDKLFVPATASLADTDTDTDKTARK